MNTVLIIQVLLIVVVVLVVARLFRSRGARAQAIRRIGLVVFAAFAAVSILFPDVWSRIARIVGVGRGTDLVLYALVVAFLSFTVTTYLRFRDLETNYTRLARRIALTEAPRPTERERRPRRMTLATLPERAGRSVVTGALVLFAVWTLVYQVALFTGLPATPSLVVAAVLGVLALVALSRLRPDGRRDPMTFPGSRAALAVLPVVLVATLLATNGQRLAGLTLGVVTALVALVLSSRWAPRLEVLRRFRADSADPAASAATSDEPAADETVDDPASAPGRPGSAPWLWATGWLVALVCGGLAAYLATPDGDDAYFVEPVDLGRRARQLPVARHHDQQ